MLRGAYDSLKLGSLCPFRAHSLLFEAPTLSLHSVLSTMENRKSGSNPPHHPGMATESDEWLVPTSQSQDLRPFLISPTRPGGTALFKNTTPKPLRRSQGYITPPAQPLPSILTTIRMGGHIATQETNSVATSQVEEAELQTPDSVRAGTLRVTAHVTR